MTSQKAELFLLLLLLNNISPYLFFWQTSHEVEEEILHGKTSLKLRRDGSNKEITYAVDVISGMFVSKPCDVLYRCNMCQLFSFSRHYHTINTSRRCSACS